MSPRDEDLPVADDTPRPSHVELVPLAAQALNGATPVQEALVTALMTYLQITGIYVRSGRSSLVMQEAFDAGVAAIRTAADAMIRESTKTTGVAQS